MSFFRRAHGCGGGEVWKDPFPKIGHIYPNMIKLGTIIPYLKKIQKLVIFVVSRNTDMDCILVHNFSFF